MVLPLARRRPWKVAREMADSRSPVGRSAHPRRGARWSARTRVRRLRRGCRCQGASGKAGRGSGCAAGLVDRRAVRLRGRAPFGDRAQLLPPPRQQHVPIWVGGEWPDHRAPFRRAARFDGVHPLLFSVGAARSARRDRRPGPFHRRHRTSDGPVRIVFGTETAGDGSSTTFGVVQSFAEVGVTWWMEPISHWRGPLDAMRDRIRRGPPRDPRP